MGTTPAVRGERHSTQQKPTPSAMREMHGRRVLHLHLRRPSGAAQLVHAYRNLGETDQTARLQGRVDPASFRWSVLTIAAR